MKRLLFARIISFALILLSFVLPFLGAFVGLFTTTGNPTFVEDLHIPLFTDLSGTVAIVLSMVIWVVLTLVWVLFVFVKQLSDELVRITVVVLGLAAFSFLGAVVGLFVGLSGTQRCSSFRGSTGCFDLGRGVLCF